METIYEEMNDPLVVSQILQTTGFEANMMGSISWVVAGGRDDCKIVFRQTDPRLDTSNLREAVRKYVEARRLGLSKEFVIPRLVIKRPFSPPASPAAAAVLLAQQILPGIGDDDIRMLKTSLASFPTGSLPNMDADLGRSFVMQDTAVSHFFVLSENKKDVSFHCWISSVDLNQLRLPEMRRLVDQTVKEVSKGTGRSPGRRNWLGGYWLVLEKKLTRFPDLQWHSPEKLNPLHLFD
jgi:hypothetical protein